jgi:predicted ribosome quality control (RQC) complex YloA/Tae2 family protein
LRAVRRHPAGVLMLLSVAETMDDQAIDEVVAEIKPLLVDRGPGKLFQLGPLTLAIDLRLRDHRYLFLSVEPALPRIHLIKRRVRDLEKHSMALTQFALALKKELSNTKVLSVEKDPADRIVRFRFAGKDELGQARERRLIAQLTGRAANLFLLDRDDVITHRAREAPGRGQQVGEQFHAPPIVRPAATGDRQLFRAIRSGSFASASEATDAYYVSVLSQQAFNSNAAAARAALRKKISRHEKLLKKLQADLAGHAEAEQHKRIGDLLLANLITAQRTGKRVKLVDLFTEDAPLIEIEVDEKLTLTQEASRRFALYSRSKRAVGRINLHIEAVRAELDKFWSQRERLEKIIADRDEAALEELTGALSVPPALAGGFSKRKPEKKIPGTRRYLSSDGFEILVGRAARDNDHLTFKVARPNDLWLHAADYGGSHVVVRNSTRKDVPHKTIIEAAQLAAQFSRARKDPKVDVNYTQRKFVSKPKGAAPGLVRLSRFKNITVEPGETPERIP